MPVTFQVVGNLADFGNSPRAGVKVRANASPGVKIGDVAVHSNEPETVLTDETGAFTLELVSLPGVWYRIQTPYGGALPTVNLAGYVPDVADPTTGVVFPADTVIDVKDVANENPHPGYEAVVFGGNATWAALPDKPTLSTVATSGAYADLTGKPTLGTAAATNATAYATSAQGTKADTAVQPAALTSAVAAFKPQGNGFIALGDSVSTSYAASSGGAGYGAAWPHMACALSQQRLNYLDNAGVTGNTTAQMLARLSTDVLAKSPKIVTLLGGTNDLTQSVTFSTWSANIKSMAAQLRAAGIRVVLCTIPPRGNTTYLTTQLTWNAWLRQFALDNSYDLLDFFALLADPATGIFKSGYDSGDALHPSQAAHIVMANYAKDAIQTGPYSPPQATLDTGDAANLLAHPLLAAGTPTPTSWVTAGSGSADWAEGLVTDSDFKGKAWQVAFTNALSAGNFRTFSSFTVASGGSTFQPGDVLAIGFKAKVTVATNVIPSGTAGLRLQVVGTSGAALTTPIAATGTVHGAALHWFRFTVPASDTSTLKLSAVIGAIPVGASFTVLLGEFFMVNLSKIASTAP